MPCNSDYMNPTEREQLLVDTAILLVWLLNKLELPRDEEAERTAQSNYGENGERCVVKLCEILTNGFKRYPKKLEKIVYNGRDKMARMLASWWEDHQSADRIREREEAEAALLAEEIKREKEKEVSATWDMRHSVEVELPVHSAWCWLNCVMHKGTMELMKRWNAGEN